uniref:Uncharacterized protein n=1 Tax=Triticum urartu TaxID=4572 RepID=A0A8R7NZ76_TRIUA
RREKEKGNRRGRLNSGRDRVAGRCRPAPARSLAQLPRRERRRGPASGAAAAGLQELAEVVLAKQAGGSKVLPTVRNGRAQRLPSQPGAPVSLSTSKMPVLCYGITKKVVSAILGDKKKNVARHQSK